MSDLTPEFYVYLHKRPDGSVFYVGKGSGRRAYDFAPTRRTAHHVNVVRKHGRENVEIALIPCTHEEAAFELEQKLIAVHRDSIVNLTDGGEGCSGRVMTSAQAEALERGRVKGKRGAPQSPALRAVLSNWKASEQGQSHLQALGAAGAARLHAVRTVVCAQCTSSFETKSAKAKCCSRLCEQRHRRARGNA